MNNSTFLEILHSGGRIVSDGATGTNLIARGLPHGTTAENWVLEQPEQIIRLHEEFIAAGADLLQVRTVKVEGRGILPLASLLKEKGIRAGDCL